MKLVNVRNMLKKEYPDYVIIMKYGNFYRVFDDDVYLIWFKFNYKINDNRIGFPINVLIKVKDYLDDKQISYLIYDGVVYKNSYLYNNYEVILNSGRDLYYKCSLLDKLKDLPCIYELEGIVKKYE